MNFTDGVGHFYSGVAGQTKCGMEASGLAAVNLKNEMAMHLEMVQTVHREEDETLLGPSILLTCGPTCSPPAPAMSTVRGSPTKP